MSVPTETLNSTLAVKTEHAPKQAPQAPRVTKHAKINVEQRDWPTLTLLSTVFNVGQMQEAASSLPQVALAGRSNVGKSSLLNALARRKQLARISSTPGKTRSINFFLIEPDNFILADLPGYGYAKRAKSEKTHWGNLIQAYLLETPPLRAVLLLLDCRLCPQQLDLDLAFFARSNNLPLQAVLTKADKCTQKERVIRQKEWAPHLGFYPIPVSAKTNMGLDTLWKELRHIGGPDQGQEGATVQEMEAVQEVEVKQGHA